MPVGRIRRCAQPVRDIWLTLDIVTAMARIIMCKKSRARHCEAPQVPVRCKTHSPYSTCAGRRDAMSSQIQPLPAPPSRHSLSTQSTAVTEIASANNHSALRG